MFNRLIIASCMALAVIAFTSCDKANDDNNNAVPVNRALVSGKVEDAQDETAIDGVAFHVVYTYDIENAGQSGHTGAPPSPRSDRQTVDDGIRAWLHETTQVLHDSCPDGTAAIPDGRTVRLFFDEDNDGPDSTDPQPQVGDGPGQFNFVTFPMNGQDALNVPGMFYADDILTLIGPLPFPDRYYLRVSCRDTTHVQWTSEVFDLLEGDNNVELSYWVCNGCEDIAPPCGAPAIVDLIPEFDNYVARCVPICAGRPLQIRVFAPEGVQLSPYFPPVLDVQPGCRTSNCMSGCSQGELSLAGTIPYSNWLWTGDYFATTLAGLTDGCACVALLDFLPADLVQFEAEPLDHSARLTWTTARESNCAAFVLLRQIEGEHVVSVATIPAHNSGLPNSYTYVDDSLSNGTEYTYRLATHSYYMPLLPLDTVTVTPDWHYREVAGNGLYQNFPNSFADTTKILFDLISAQQATLTVTVHGSDSVIVDFGNEMYTIGRHSISFPGLALANGLYDVHFRTNVLHDIVTMLKDTPNDGRLRAAQPLALSQLDGRFTVGIDVGETVIIMDDHFNRLGTAALQSVDLVAIKAGYRSESTSLILNPGDLRNITIRMYRSE